MMMSSIQSSLLLKVLAFFISWSSPETFQGS
ncbi:hypothetical protein EMIT0P2_130142 [Pseudomonas sp. IT-P2]